MQDWRDERIAELEAGLAARGAQLAAKDARITELEQRVAELSTRLAELASVAPVLLRSAAKNYALWRIRQLEEVEPEPDRFGLPRFRAFLELRPSAAAGSGGLG